MAVASYAYLVVCSYSSVTQPTGCCAFASFVLVMYINLFTTEED